jgi:carboxyl-terminal processing protease
MQMSRQDSGTSFVGIGIEMMPVEQGIMIRRVTKGSGAAAAGLQAGDIITAVEGKSLAKLGQDEIVSMVRGLVGTKVTLTVQRDAKVFNVVVTRAKIVNPVVSSEEVNYLNKKVAYIRLENFMYEKACNELAQIIADSEKRQVDGYVLDLRNNPGGNVVIAACLAGLFIGANKIVAYFEERTPFGNNLRPLLSTANITTAKPLSVLINAYSASASELIAGSFRDHNRAIVVGQKSFGKGSHQGCSVLRNQPTLTMCSTRGLFFAPSGESNQTIGVTPHLEAFLNKTANEVLLYALREEQMYLFPLDPKKVSNVTPGNWNQLKAPVNCIKQLNLDAVYNQATGADQYFKDYQLLNALAAVNCHGMN